MAEDNMAAMDARDISKKLSRSRTQGKQKRIFRPVIGETKPCLTNRFSVLETCTVGFTRDMLTHCHLLSNQELRKP